MAEARIEPGAVLEFTTPEEAKAIVYEALGSFLELPLVVRPSAQGTTTSGGALTLEVYDVPVGFEFVLTRLVIEADGFTPGAPYTAAGAYVLVRRQGGARVNFASLVSGSGQLPTLFTDSVTSGAHFRNGEKVEVVVSGGPASTGIQVTAEGILRRPR